MGGGRGAGVSDFFYYESKSKIIDIKDFFFGRGGDIGEGGGKGK